MKVTSSRALEFACHSAACAPPSAGGTGGSNPGGKGKSYSPRSAILVDANGTNITAHQERRMKPGTRRTIKDENGEKLGTIKRDSKGVHWYETTNGAVMGGAKNVPEAIAKLKQSKGHDQHYLASWTSPKDRTPEQKALLKGYSDKSKSERTAKLASTPEGAKLKAYGPVKATQIVIGKDGTVKIKGEVTKHKIVKTVAGYTIPEVLNGRKTNNGTSGRIFSTQKAAKSAVARYISSLANA